MKISQFIKEVRAESKHISWPTKKATTLFTIAVVIASLFVGYYLGLFDFLFGRLLNTVV